MRPIEAIIRFAKIWIHRPRARIQKRRDRRRQVGVIEHVIELSSELQPDSLTYANVTQHGEVVIPKPGSLYSPSSHVPDVPHCRLEQVWIEPLHTPRNRR